MVRRCRSHSAPTSAAVRPVASGAPPPAPPAAGGAGGQADGLEYARVGARGVGYEPGDSPASRHMSLDHPPEPTSAGPAADGPV